jgi:hypothetical protein
MILNAPPVPLSAPNMLRGGAARQGPFQDRVVFLTGVFLTGEVLPGLGRSGAGCRILCPGGVVLRGLGRVAIRSLGQGRVVFLAGQACRRLCLGGGVFLAGMPRRSLFLG